MKTCHLTEPYLDGSLSEGETSEFETHLDACRDCRTRVDHWRDIKKEVAAFESVADQAEPTEVGATALVDALRTDQKEKRERKRAKLTLVGAFAFGASFATILFVFNWPTATPDRPVTEKEVPVSSLLFKAGSDHPVNFPVTRMMESPKNGRILTTLGNDRIGLAKESRLHVLETTTGMTRLKLEKGLVACEVAKRAQADFVVEAGVYQVRVLGTRFSAEYDGRGTVRVSVAEGRVTVVSGQGRTWTLKRGESLEATTKGGAKKSKAGNGGMETIIYLLGTEEPTPPKRNIRPSPSQETTTKPSTGSTEDTEVETTRHKGGVSKVRVVIKEVHLFEEWRELIDQGDYLEAARRINAHLIAHPDDGEAWLLLAQVRRKVKNWASAISACQRAILNGPPATANRARFISAAIYQDQLNDSPRAIALLRKFLQEGEKGSEREEIAKLRLAKGLMVIGNGRTAASILDKLIEKSPRPTIAKKAWRLRRRLPTSLDDISTSTELK